MEYPDKMIVKEEFLYQGQAIKRGVVLELQLAFDTEPSAEYSDTRFPHVVGEGLILEDFYIEKLINERKVIVIEK